MVKTKKNYVFKWKSIAIIVITFCIVYTFGQQMIKSYQMQKEVKMVEMQINQMKNKNEDLKLTVKDLEGKDYVEKIAREKLGLVKPGEKVILRAKPGVDIKVQPRDNTSLRD